MKTIRASSLLYVLALACLSDVVFGVWLSDRCSREIVRTVIDNSGIAFLVWFLAADKA